MDLSRPISSLIPGVQGKLLETLASAGQSLSSGSTARIAGVSENRASKILRDLANFGVLVRKDAGNTALYELSPTNLTAKMVRELFHLRTQLYEQMTLLAQTIQRTEPDVWIAVFGSTSRGSSDSESDIDVLIVRSDPTKESADNREVWDLLLLDYSLAIQNLAGNPVNIVEYWRSEVNLSTSFWREVLRDQVTVLGSAPILVVTETKISRKSARNHRRSQVKESLFWPITPGSVAARSAWLSVSSQVKESLFWPITESAAIPKKSLGLEPTHG